MVVKRVISLFKSLCSDVAKRVARLCYLFYRSFSYKNDQKNEHGVKNLDTSGQLFKLSLASV